jgi:uncharacterized membrane protein YbhN (UPF0104 family)
MSPRARQILNGAILFAGLAFCVVSLVRLQRLHPLYFSPDPAALAAFVLLGIGALAAMAVAWQRYVFAFFAVRLPLRHAAYQSCLMLVAKYVPVMIAGFVARISAYGAYASASRIVFATLTELIGAIAAATVVGLGCLAVAFVPLALPLVIAVAAVAIAIAPALIGKTLAIVSRLRRAAPAPEIPADPATRRALREAPLAQIVQWILLAGFVAITVRLVAPMLGAGTLLVVSGAYALAVVVGIAVVFLPGGIGVREAVFVGLASSRLDTPTALQLALALRIAMSVFDLIAGAGCLLLRGAADGGRKA